MGFYDAKGYWRSDGEGFYDAKGNWVSPGGVFYDSKGYRRSPGDGFYDSKGNWVSPGDAFYDGRGYLQSPNAAVDDSGGGFAAGLCFLLALPILLLWSMVVFMVEWVAAHIALVFVGYLLADAFLCLAITRRKKHRGIWAIFSFVGNYICILSFLYLMLVYVVPYVLIHQGSVEAFFEFGGVCLLGAGGVAVVQFFNYYHEKALLELLCGVLFFAIVCKLLQNGIQDMVTIKIFLEIYGEKSSAWMDVVFGFLF